MLQAPAHTALASVCFRCLPCCRCSLLQLSYLDLFLIHWPVTGCSGPVLTPSTGETWAAMEACVEAGLTRSIGVSNFSRAKLQQLLDSPQLKIRPAVLQVRVDVGWQELRYAKCIRNTPSPIIVVISSTSQAAHRPHMHSSILPGAIH